MELDPVYAVLVCESRYGEPLYEPRSQAQLAKRQPKLWSAKHQAENVADRNRLRGHKHARVVEFRLVPVEPEKEQRQ